MAEPLVLICCALVVCPSLITMDCQSRNLKQLTQSLIMENVLIDFHRQIEKKIVDK